MVWLNRFKLNRFETGLSASVNGAIETQGKVSMIDTFPEAKVSIIDTFPLAVYSYYATDNTV